MDAYNPYKPGQAVRLRLRSTADGKLTDPSSPTLTVSGPDGPTSVAPVRDSTGCWHGDFLIPMGATTDKGPWFYRWRSVGASVDENALAEERFQVEALDF